MWKALQKKYKTKLQTTGKQYIANFIGYKMSAETTIEKA